MSSFQVLCVIFDEPFLTASQVTRSLKPGWNIYDKKQLSIESLVRKHLTAHAESCDYLKEMDVMPSAHITERVLWKLE